MSSENQPRIDADYSRIYREDVKKTHLLHREITEKILGAAFAIHSELGPGFLENAYETALIYELKDRGVEALNQAEIPAFYKSRAVGLYYADILVDGKIICEIKAIRSLTREHDAQLLHYLTATGKDLGMLLNFGTSSLQHKRLAKSK